MDTLTSIGTPDLLGLLERQRRGFEASPFPTASERRNNLAKLAASIQLRKSDIVAAVSADFGNRTAFETVMTEITPVLSAIKFARKHLMDWMKPSRRSTALTFLPAHNHVEYTPLGVIGIIAAWNYPIYLTLGPLVDALAAGNRAMIKPSELSPRFSVLLQDMLGECFGEDEVAVVLGELDVAQKFCALPFDHMLFTGSTNVGRDVMRAAAQNLVPVTLELGGKSPVIVAEDYDVAKAAISVAFGKLCNGGQACVAPDYALIPTKSAALFANQVIVAAERMYPELEGNKDYTAIISPRHRARLGEMVAEAEMRGAKVLRHKKAANMPDDAAYFPPTVVLNPPLDSRLMREEVFGPILSVISVDTLDQAIRFINDRPRPLALYAFTSDRSVERRVLDRTISGGVGINTTLVHVARDDLPFGGVGPSGMGCYHGRDGFRLFSHIRGIHKAGAWSALEILKAPYRRRANLAMRFVGGCCEK